MLLGDHFLPFPLLFCCSKVGSPHSEGNLETDWFFLTVPAVRDNARVEKAAKDLLAEFNLGCPPNDTHPNIPSVLHTNFDPA